MSTTPETVPTVWSQDDETFFRAVADVLAPSFLQGAGVLLASYDPEDDAVVPELPRQSRPTAGLPSQRSLAA